MAPLALVFAVFFVLPARPDRRGELLAVQRVLDDPGVRVEQLCVGVLRDALDELPGLCLTFKTYLSTLELCAVVWAVTLVLGFTIAYFLAFHVRSLTDADGAVPRVHHPVLDVERHPHGLVGAAARAERRSSTRSCRRRGWRHQPVEWLLFSSFSVVVAFVHLYTMFMIVPIFNSMSRIDRVADRGGL